MNIISVQPITDRPIIDAIAPDDFMLIGDASDNNVVKRVLVSALKNYFVASSPTPTPTPTPTGFALRVNCGGVDYVDTLGKTWLADFGFTGGSAAFVNDPVANTVEDTLFKSERWGVYSYSFAVTAGAIYTLNLLFSEGQGAYAVGSRVFNIKVDGQTVLNNFDIRAEVAGQTAMIKTFTITAIANTLQITTEAIVDNPSITAIEVLG